MTYMGPERRNDAMSIRHLAMLAGVVAALIIILTVTAGIALERSAHQDDQRLRDAQVRSCERVNTLRAESNRRIRSHQIDTAVLRRFLASARDARYAAYERDRERSDLRAAGSYQALIGQLRVVSFREVPLTDCEAAFPRP